MSFSLFESEIRDNNKLRLVYWSLLAGSFLSLISAYQKRLNTPEKIQSFDYLCPSYFQDCFKIQFPSALPVSWDHQIFLGLFVITLFLSCYFFLKERYKTALLLLLPEAFLSILSTFFLTVNSSTPFEFFHTGFLIVLIFFPQKEFFLKLVFCVLYFCSGLIKLDHSWIFGEYFNSLALGMPIIPNFFIPIVTNLVIAFELVFVFFLLGFNRKNNRVVFYFFMVFHLYSIFLVGIRYPIHCLPILFFLFRDFELTKFRRENFLLLCYPVILFLLNLPPLFISDSKATYEGFRPAINMFDSNRQCRANYIITDLKGRVQKIEKISSGAYSRCSVYHYFYPMKQKCNKGVIKSAVFSVDVSLDGGALERYVEDIDICQVEFKHWGPNDWIERNRRSLGFPTKNSYFEISPVITLKDLEIRDSKVDRQLDLKDYIFYIKWFYFVLGIASFGFHILCLLKVGTAKYPWQ